MQIGEAHATYADLAEMLADMPGRLRTAAVSCPAGGRIVLHLSPVSALHLARAVEAAAEIGAAQRLHKEIAALVAQADLRHAQCEAQIRHWQHGLHGTVAAALIAVAALIATLWVLA